MVIGERQSWFSVKPVDLTSLSIALESRGGGDGCVVGMNWDLSKGRLRPAKQCPLTVTKRLGSFSEWKPADSLFLPWQELFQVNYLVVVYLQVGALVSDRLLSTFQDIKDIVFSLDGDCDWLTQWSGSIAGGFNSLPPPGAGMAGLMG